MVGVQGGLCSGLGFDLCIPESGSCIRFLSNAESSVPSYSISDDDDDVFALRVLCLILVCIHLIFFFSLQLV